LAKWHEVETMAAYDGIVIGAGHNGLIAQAYLARAGLKVISLDAGSVAGGGLTTVEDGNHPGFLHNLHSYFHRGITSMPWFTDLELARYGVEYIDNDLYVSVLQRDGNVIQWWDDFERTFQSFAAIDRDDAERLRYWRDQFIPITRDIIRPEAAAPPVEQAVRRARLEKSVGGRLLLQVGALSPYEFVSQEFRHPAIKAALLFINGMREVDLRAKGFGHHLPSLFATSAKVQTCRGGAVSLAHALVRSIEAAGGIVRTNAPVKRILRAGSRAVGVQLESGEELTASRCVVSSVNPQITFLDLMDRSQLPHGWAEKAERFEYNKLGPLFTLHLNLKEPPIYKASDRFPEVQRSLMVIMGIDHSDTFLDLVRCHDEGVMGPTVLWGGTPTVLDPSQAPAGHHTAFMWEKTPYALRGSSSNWIDEKPKHAKRMLELWCQYAPNLRTAIIDSFAQSPHETAIHNPNMREADVLIGAFKSGQIGIGRPFAGAGDYRTFLDGLYLCGSSSHPGGNITGLPGYNAAHVIISDHLGRIKPAKQTHATAK
jgi:phytoene dehydrogenase-like protein